MGFINHNTYGDGWNRVKAAIQLGLPYGDSLPVVDDENPGSLFYLTDPDPLIEGTYELTSAFEWRKLMGSLTSISVIKGIVPFVGAVANEGDPETININAGDDKIYHWQWVGVNSDRIIFFRNGSIQDDFDPGDGGTFFTKSDADNFITLSHALNDGEKIKINTI